MNYNNYQYGYNSYPYQSQQVAQPTYQQTQQSLNNYNNYQGVQMQQSQRAKYDFLPISNVEEVKSYLMNPNSTVLFKDVNNKIIYEKKTDSQGISEIKAYQETTLINNEYVRQQDFISFKNELESKINNLTQKYEKTIVGQNSSQNEGF